MAATLPTLYLVRHGDTDWTDSHRKTGRTDLPLNERGEKTRASTRRSSAISIL